ncbi:hypothetical protein [Pandoravirus japonicus]|uniref:Uncharacterized protein n=1 Tax=Pandoravirus japonicus TaxID=2823154 RepID=A0A811BPD5_9VIRU|nr:hypothetical protein [Pandoravirus japonicus]
MPGRAFSFFLSLRRLPCGRRGICDGARAPGDGQGREKQKRALFRLFVFLLFSYFSLFQKHTRFKANYRLCLLLCPQFSCPPWRPPQGAAT